MPPIAACAASDIRRKTSAEAGGQTERLIRVASAVLDGIGGEMSHNRMVKHIRRFERTAATNGWSFFDYFTNAIRLDSDRRRELLSRPDIARVIAYADPTGETAVNHVMRERGQS